MEWKDISIFISSTFNDMHAERDYLLKKVFPELSQWCAQRCLRLIDLDLRWGVTSADAQSGNTVYVCLKNIDQCRPFFLCFLGQRRGWIPQKNEISDRTYLDYPGIAASAGMKTVTEMEIDHALLAPMRSIVNGVSLIPDADKCAAFFIRSDAYLSDLNDSQRRIFTNSGEPDPTEADRNHADFIRKVRLSSDTVFDYDCRFDKDAYSPELKTEGEDVSRGRLVDFNINGKPLHTIVIECLKEKICSVYPERASVDVIQTENDESTIQEIKLKTVTNDIILRRPDLDVLESYCEAPNGKPLYVCAHAGFGKTTLLAAFFRKHCSNYSNAFMRFCGISAKSSSWYGIWKSIGESVTDTLIDKNSIREKLPELLRAVSDCGPALIVLDGVDSLSEGLSVLSQLPVRLPDNLRLIVSFRNDMDAAPVLLRHAAAMNTARVHTVLPLSPDDEARRIVDTFLKTYLKALDDAQIETICRKEAATNPLFLKILLSELRVFGAFKQLNDEIAAFGTTPFEAFGKVLDRLENDISYSDVPNNIFIPNLFSILCVIRNSIRFADLRSALVLATSYSDEEVSDSLAVTLRQIRPYLNYSGDRLRIAYDTLSQAAYARYPEYVKRIHAILAEALKEHDPIESFHHLRITGNEAEIHRRSADIGFIVHCIQTSDAYLLKNEMDECSTAVDSQVYSCIRSVTSNLYRYPDMAAAILYRELENPDYRAQAFSMIRKPFICCDRIEAECTNSPQTLRFGSEFAIEHQILSCAVAREKGLAFMLAKEAEITVRRLSDGKITSVFALPCEGRIKKIICTSAGEILGAVFPDNRLTLFRLAVAEDGSILGVAAVVSDSCASVRFGGVCAFSSGERIVWQNSEGRLMHLDAAQAGEDIISTDTCDLHLTDRLCGAYGNLLVWKSDGVYILESKSGNKLREFGCRVNFYLVDGETVYVALENKTIAVFSGEELSETGVVPLRESAVSLSPTDEGVLAADRYGRLTFIVHRTFETQDCGGISQTSALIDAETVLTDLGCGRISFISNQRIAVLTADKKENDRLMAAYESDRGLRLLWFNNTYFTFCTESGKHIRLERPIHLGQNVNWDKNVKFAWDCGVLAYEYAVGKIRIVSDTDDCSCDIGALTCSISRIHELGLFAAATPDGRLLFISENGRILSQFELPLSDNNAYMLCECGNRLAVLVRRVRLSSGHVLSNIIEDHLICFDRNGPVWQRSCCLGTHTVKQMCYDGKTKTLYLFENNYVETVSVSSGRVLAEKPFDKSLCNLDLGIAIGGDFAYCACLEDHSLQALDTDIFEQKCVMPSVRRLTAIIQCADSVLLIENDKFIYRITVHK